MRGADHGFFDVAVTFDYIFCTAKLDCDAGDILHDASGERADTIVLGFACAVTESGDARTVLYLDDLALDCTSPSALEFDPDLMVRVAGEPGNQCEAGQVGACAAVDELGAFDADDVLFQVAIHRDVELLAGGGGVGGEHVYWNTSLGVHRPAIGQCRLRARGTAAPFEGNAAVSNGVIAAGAVYPYIQWDVPLGACGSEALSPDPDALVRVMYSGVREQGAGGGAPSEAPAIAFANGFGRGFPAGSFCEPPCVFGSACIDGECVCGDCLEAPGECYEPTGTCGDDGACVFTPLAGGVGCGDDGNPCTRDVCDGVGACAHPAGNAGALCRLASGPCDVAEHCDGASASCPEPSVSWCGACGPAAGGSSVLAPDAGLCAEGEASALDGTGPWAWACLGGGGGADAACASDRSCDATTLAWGGACAAAVAVTTHGGSLVLVNEAAGWVGGAVASCAQGAWSTTETSCVEIINAGCGSADGQSTLTAPDAGLCAAGAASAVTGAGPWSWTCAGQGGGADASCASDRGCAATTLGWSSSCSAAVDEAAHGAEVELGNSAAGWVGVATATCDQGAWSTGGEVCVEVIDASCGAAAGVDTLAAPSADLCASGTASVVTGAGPFMWSCSGQGGGANVVCQADRSCAGTTLTWGEHCQAAVVESGEGVDVALGNEAAGYVGGATATCTQGVWSASAASCVEIINASCGSAEGGSGLAAPAGGLCATGTASAVTGAGPYFWSCTGQGGGANDMCSAHRSCAAGTIDWGGSCSAAVGEAAHGGGDALTNGAAGWVGAATASCDEGVWSTSETSCVEIINAGCGSAAGQSTLTAPATGLCAAGAASAVTGSGPWTWSCAGQGGGADASCSADRSCAAAELTWSGSCGGAQASQAHGWSGALGNSAAGWVGAATASCDQGTWSTSATSCNAIVNGSCGSADGGSTASQPSGASLCAAGTATAVSGTGPYSWSCSGAFGGATDTCSSNRSCGTQSLTWQTSCSASQTAANHGYSGALGNTAAGWSGAATATCNQGTWSTSATSCDAIVNGSCGSADGGSSASQPSGASLCAAGTATVVSGTGPYSWSCTGAFGGTTASCSSNRSCAATTSTWSSCSAARSAQSHGFSGSLTNTVGGWSGSVTTSCNQGTWSQSGATCDAVVNGSCGSADGGSTASQPSGASLCAAGTATAVSGAGPYSWSCTGAFGGTTASCSSNRSCAATTSTWSSCSAARSAQSHGFSGSLTNTVGGWSGSVTTSCSQGTWSQSGATCTAVINGSCGSAHGGSTFGAPTSGLCASGSATGVSGSGPYSWSCTGSGGGSTVGCGSNQSCDATTVTWLTSCSAARSAQDHGFSGSLTNTASSYVGSVTTSCSQGAWNQSGATCSEAPCTPGAERHCGTCRCGDVVQRCQANGTWGPCNIQRGCRATGACP